MSDRQVMELFTSTRLLPPIDQIDVEQAIRTGRRRRIVRTAATVTVLLGVVTLVGSLALLALPRIQANQVATHPATQAPSSTTTRATTRAPSPSVTLVPMPLSTRGRAVAGWTYAPGFTPSPEATSLVLNVAWDGCAGASAVKNPRAVVSYSASHVTLTVWGDVNSARCSAPNPVTTVEVVLSEPLGTRTVVSGAATGGTAPGHSPSS
jgi:hypothetical protein